MTRHYEPAVLVDLGAAEALILGMGGVVDDNPVTGIEQWLDTTDADE